SIRCHPATTNLPLTCIKTQKNIVPPKNGNHFSGRPLGIVFLCPPNSRHSTKRYARGDTLNYDKARMPRGQPSPGLSLLAEAYRLERVINTNGVGQILVSLYDGIHSTLPAGFANPAYATMLELALNFLKVSDIGVEAENEAQLEAFHMQLSPAICRLASNFYLLQLLSEFPGSLDTLTFPWDTSFLVTNISSGSPPITIDYVIDIKPERAHLASIPPQLAEVLRGMSRHRLSNMEAKFGTVATEQVAQQISTLVGAKLPWEFCPLGAVPHDMHQSHKIVTPKITIDSQRWTKRLEEQMQAESSSPGPSSSAPHPTHRLPSPRRSPPPPQRPFRHPIQSQKRRTDDNASFEDEPKSKKLK
ncbi:hypothetical protein DFH07DRAFT_824938, partial [Mycena maculata]